MLIRWAIVHQEQQGYGGQTVHEPVEPGLGLGIEPMQILDDQHHGLGLTDTHQQAFESIQHADPPLHGVELPERLIGRQGVEQGQERRHGILEAGVQGLDLRGEGRLDTR